MGDSLFVRRMRRRAIERAGQAPAAQKTAGEKQGGKGDMKHYICMECGHSFPEYELQYEVITPLNPFGFDPPEAEMQCPCCKAGEIEEAVFCQYCDAWVRETTDAFDMAGMCKACYTAGMKELDAMVYGTASLAAAAIWRNARIP